MLLLAAVAAARLPILLAPVIAAMATAAAAPYLPCVSAVTPRVVDDADLPAANAARSAVASTGIILGPALGGVLLLLGSPAFAFAVNALTFGLSAVAVLAIRAGSDRDPFRCARSADRPAGLLRDMARGAAALRARPEALRLVGADIMCSVTYGTQTVLLLVVSRQIGLGPQGYGYLFAGIGAGGLLGTALAGRASRSRYPRHVLALALAAAGLPMALLAVVHWPAVAIFLTGLTGAGALLVEILTETVLQRALGEDTFGSAYGLALPASLGGIVVGSLVAPVLVGVLGGSGALVAVGCAVLAYALVVLRGSVRVPGAIRPSQPAVADAVPAR
jgi:predicted MFS family arabinose efflux permease